MGFWFDDFATEWKQHLNLSESAWLIINEDIKNFYSSEREESFAGFLNRVFKNFYQVADASVSLRINQKREEMEAIYASMDADDFIDRYLEKYEADLLNKNNSYSNGKGEKFRINKETLELLRESPESDYYNDNVGKYLKAVFEEYVNLPTYVREEIFFNETITKIKSAIINQRKLKITLNEKVSVRGDVHYNRKFYVSPYKITQDYTKTYNYLIGFSKQDIDGEESPCCLRISRINKLDIQSSMGAKISKERADILEDMLLERTVMFMASEPIDIKIKFTEKGLESLRRQIYMRPRIYTVDENNKYVYTFHCTEVQAINYFFKFGWDAYILEPLSLQQSFKKRFERGLKTYSGMSKEEIYQSEEKQK